MTFIASVIAKEGVAIVADSFVTTIEEVMHEDDFFNHLAKKKKLGTSISYKELIPLFKKRPSHTQNYMVKLFPFGKWSAVTTSGQAYLNGKIIKDLVRQIEVDMDVDSPTYDALTVDEIITQFCDRLKVEVIAHLATKNLSTTSFIFTYYDRVSDAANLYSIKISENPKGAYALTHPNMVSFTNYSHLKILTDGQDAFIDRLIFGSLYTNMQAVKRGFLDYLYKELKLSNAKKTKITADITHPDFLKATIVKDVFSVDFRELSLQEALDFAALLVRIVMDIQVYTEKIPTVGGVIRLASIRKDVGFEWVAGNTIATPKIIF